MKRHHLATFAIVRGDTLRALKVSSHIWSQLTASDVDFETVNKVQSLEHVRVFGLYDFSLQDPEDVIQDRETVIDYLKDFNLPIVETNL